MKKISLLLLLLTSFSFTKVDVAVSIIPQKLFIKKIAREKVDVTVMVKQGS